MGNVRSAAPQVGNVLAIVAIFAGNLLKTSTTGQVLQYVGIGYLTLAFFFRIASGVRRRLPFWTGESWRRFLVASAAPVIAIALLFGFLALLDLGWPIIGAPRSSVRGAWVAGSVILMIFGTIGCVLAVEALHKGDPSEQFTWSPRRLLGRG